MGGSSKGSKSTGALPWWVRGPHETLIDKAEILAYGDESGYVPYDQPRFAGLTPQEQAANVAREEMFNKGDVAGQFAADQYTKSAGLTDQVWGVANSEFNEDEYQRRRNPYIDNVVNKNIREADQSFNRRLNQDQASSVARGGSIGSYRVGLENAFLEGERAETLGDIRNTGELDAYNQALGSFESDRSTKLGGLNQGAGMYNAIGQGANVLGTDSANREYQMINELDRAGAIQREMRDKELALGYSDFKEEQNWGWNQLNKMSGILSGVPTQGTGTQSFDPGSPSNISQLLGLGLGAASINQIFGGGQ